MQHKIEIQIEESNFELIRNRIAEILSIELPQQDIVGSDFKVWLERFIPFDTDELPAAIVSFDSQTSDNHNPLTRRGGNNFFIDIYYQEKHSVDSPGDKAGSIKAQRLAGVCAFILSSSEYFLLGFNPGVINNKHVVDIRVARESIGDSLHTVIARLTFSVTANEGVQPLTPADFEEIFSQMKIGETEKGHVLQVNNS